MFDIDPPRNRQSLYSGLHSMHSEVHQALVELPTEVFVAPQGEYWSPADHLRHLIRSNRPLAIALGSPKLILRFRFGKSAAPSQSFEQIVERYHALLAAGGKASGRFLPSPKPSEGDDRAWQRMILERWKSVGDDLQGLYRKWGDKPLDRLVLPHPLLGNLTVREMLYFTLYHNHHHARRIFERM